MAEMIYIFHGKNDLWAESAEYRTDRYTKKWMHGADLNKSAPEGNPDDPATSASPHHPHT